MESHVVNIMQMANDISVINKGSEKIGRVMRTASDRSDKIKEFSERAEDETLYESK
jgi:hypothetical protein